MHVFIVYAHPSENSFTSVARDEFIKGLESSGHTYEISDLYKMKFNAEMSEEEYFRQAYHRLDLPVPEDVIEEQSKINRCDALVFIYPVFWTEAPAKLVGWFDRVWTYGFATGERTMRKISKALVICITGNTVDKLEKFGHLTSMKTIMLGDRLFDRVSESEMIVLDETMKFKTEQRTEKWDRHLKTAYEAGRML
ncbi:MAG: NAD(P)H-dependent oxidoreductase [Desulfitobacteriaceae bacterium]